MILVTGASGFLGAELVKQLLATESHVRCLKRKTSAIPKKLQAFSERIEWVEADILDFSDLEDAFDGVNQVYHCAALVSFDEKLKAQMLAVNAEGTANVVNLCLQFGVQKLVHVSSIAALGNGENGAAITEKSFWEGFEIKDAYAVSKYRAEMEVWRGMHEGLNAVIVNPSVIIGADAGTQGSGALFQTVKNGISFYTAGATGLVDVEDVARCMILLMHSSASRERYILNAENISYQKLFASIAKAYNLPAPSRLIKPWMLHLAWRFSAFAKLFLGKDLGLNKTVVKASQTQSLYDNSKIKAELNYRFIPLNESITKTANGIKSA
ncbi:nucleoside-diphosphate sugar epimerase [Pelobium manganitolerans]|uniref:Nucleoside-diphosphate sugar epimerase n=1 Tax=Pelobium manganitolerans TaxID=1842495 RepID=A0A419SC36_9SPHI|nr:SDR family NAD(P)-dependent oxidoreductase [Pelobium manganitolerans]RKD20385.1 nucleoside-diphosphate sugar epimerase [Pelobium manganitolerans]